MTPELQALMAQLGAAAPWVAAVISILGPFIRDKAWPAYMEARKATQAQNQALLERTLTALIGNTAVLGSLQETLQELTEHIRRLDTDVAGLYEQRGKPRPSSRHNAGTGETPS